MSTKSNSPPGLTLHRIILCDQRPITFSRDLYMNVRWSATIQWREIAFNFMLKESSLEIQHIFIGKMADVVYNDTNYARMYCSHNRRITEGIFLGKGMGV